MRTVAFCGRVAALASMVFLNLHCEKAASASLDSNVYRWKPVAIGGGGFITGYDADSSGTTRVARSDVYGAYIWRSQASRWVQLVTSASMPESDRRQNGLNEGAFEIVVAPSDPDRIYMALKGSVYRSKDRGTTFEKTNLKPAQALTFDANGPNRTYGPFIAVDPANEDLLLFSCPGCGTFRTEDAGDNWVKASFPDQQNGPSADREGTLAWFQPGAVRSRIIAVKGNHRPQVSTDLGKTFRDFGSSLDAFPASARQGAFAPDGSFYMIDAESNTIWHLLGEHWKKTPLAEGLSGRSFASVAIDPRNSHVFVFDEGGRAFRSRDEGNSWTELPHSSRVGKGDPPWLHIANQAYFPISRAVFDAKVAHRIWAGSGTGMFFADVDETSDRIVWTSESRGIEELVANDVIQPRGRAPVFAAADFGIHVKRRLDEFSSTYGPKERSLISAQSTH